MTEDRKILDEMRAEPFYKIGFAQGMLTHALGDLERGHLTLATTAVRDALDALRFQAPKIGVPHAV